MISRKIVTGEREMLAQIYLKKGALVPMHSHESEQMTYVLQGALKFLIDGEEITVGKARCCRSRRGSSIRPRRSTTRSSSISSVRSGRTGWTEQTVIFTVTTNDQLTKNNEPRNPEQPPEPLNPEPDPNRPNPNLLRLSSAHSCPSRSGRLSRRRTSDACG